MFGQPMNSRTTLQLREDALAIWKAGVKGVAADRLVRNAIRREGDLLLFGDSELALKDFDNIVVVGGGKAAAGMAVGLEDAFEAIGLLDRLSAGWVNVPADCIRPTRKIHLHAARPPGANEPTSEAVAGTERMLSMVSVLGPREVCIALISGGGSALLVAPPPGVSLDDKLSVTRYLSAAGANIEELNTVRKKLSRIKGGGLSRACSAKRLISLVISDVLGDPLGIIASGPTIADSSSTDAAIAVLSKFDPHRTEIPRAIWAWLENGYAHQMGRSAQIDSKDVDHEVLGNIAVAVDAAGTEAVLRGYRYAMSVAPKLEGQANEVGMELAKLTLRTRGDPGAPDCIITGGEPVVSLAPNELRGKGGRNQQLVLAALLEAISPFPREKWPEALEGIALLSGGTDGEDGPTDAAGAYIDRDVVNRILDHNLHPEEFLRRNDAYSFFETAQGLIQIGPTHTNVGDLRVVTISR